MTSRFSIWKWVLTLLDRNVKARAAKHRARAGRTFRPLHETLEDRSLMTVTVSVIALHPDILEGDVASFQIVADDPAATVTASFQTRAGTAIEGTDYEGLGDSLTFTGSTTESVVANHDFVYQPGETF